MCIYVLTAKAQENIRDWLIDNMKNASGLELLMEGDEPFLGWWYGQAEEFQHLEISGRSSRSGAPVTFTLAAQDFESIFMSPKTRRVDTAQGWGSLEGLIEVRWDSNGNCWVAA